MSRLNDPLVPLDLRTRSGLSYVFIYRMELNDGAPVKGLISVIFDHPANLHSADGALLLYEHPDEVGRLPKVTVLRARATRRQQQALAVSNRGDIAYVEFVYGPLNNNLVTIVSFHLVIHRVNEPEVRLNMADFPDETHPGDVLRFNGRGDLFTISLNQRQVVKYPADGSAPVSLREFFPENARDFQIVDLDVAGPFVAVALEHGGLLVLQEGE